MFEFLFLSTEFLSWLPFCIPNLGLAFPFQSIFGRELWKALLQFRTICHSLSFRTRYLLCLLRLLGSL